MRRAGAPPSGDGEPGAGDSGDGEPGADLARLFQQHAAAVYRVAHRLLHDPADAADVRQHVFAALLADPDQLEGVVNPAAWLCRCAANAAKNHARGESRRRARSRAVPARPAPPDPAVPAERAEAAARLRAALHGLTEDQRTVLALRFDGGLTVAEVAAHLNIPPGTAKDRGRRALARLRALLSDPGSRDE